MGIPFSSPDINPPHSNLVNEKLNSPQDNPNFFADAMSPNLRDYTVDGLFDIAATKVETQLPALVTWCNVGVPYPKISFNPEYGYIQEYDLGSCAKWEIGGGMLCPVLADCYAGVRIRDFQPLPLS